MKSNHPFSSSISLQHRDLHLVLEEIDIFLKISSCLNLTWCCSSLSFPLPFPADDSYLHIFVSGVKLQSLFNICCYIV